MLPWIRNSGEQVPHTTYKRQLYQRVRYLCLPHTKPLKYKWTPLAAQGAKGSGVLSMSVMQPEGYLFFLNFFKVPLNDLLDLMAALYPLWQSSLNPLIC